MIPLLDYGYVKPIEHWGSDERIIEAARMSTSKGFQGWGTEEVPGDEKLLKYLYTHKHLTPFEMAGITIEIQAPIFVFREWHRHRTQSYNELSARYTELEEVFYVPDWIRLEIGKQGQKNKQGSEGSFTKEEKSSIQTIINLSCKETFNNYHRLLAMGVAREIARIVLPVGTYSKMRASGNLRNWLGFLKLRLDHNAQYEIRLYAEAVANLLDEHFPRTMNLFYENP